MVNHNHGTFGWHDHPVFDSDGDHMAAHDAADTAKLVKFFAGATWHPLAGIQWPDTIETTWANDSQFATEVRWDGIKKGNRYAYRDGRWFLVYAAKVRLI